MGVMPGMSVGIEACKGANVAAGKVATLALKHLLVGQTWPPYAA